MTKMFTFNGKRMKTWNPFTGCAFACSYCWARKLAEGKLRRSYPNGFVPEFHLNRLVHKFQPDDFVFAVSMGDIAFANIKQRRMIAERASTFPCPVLFETKDPWIFEGEIFRNPAFYLGVTLETNRSYPVTRAPSPILRYIKIQSGSFPIRFVSIEPIMDFDLNVFLRWLGHIQPEIVEIGADNYHNNLPEPDSGKLSIFIREIKGFVPNVILKQGIERFGIRGLI